MSRICSVYLNHNLFLSSFMNYHRFVRRETRRVLLVDQELLTFLKHMRSPTVLSGIYCLLISSFDFPFVIFKLLLTIFQDMQIIFLWEETSYSFCYEIKDKSIFSKSFQIMCNVFLSYVVTRLVLSVNPFDSLKREH